MKIIGSILAGLSALWLGAAEPAAPSAGGSKEEMAAVEQFLHLGDTELDEIIRVVQRIRAMTPAERAAMQVEIAQFRQLPEPQRRRMQQGWGQQSREIRDGWREMMQAATPERRAEIHAKLQTLSPEERTEYRRELVENHRSDTAKKMTPPESAGK